MSELMKIKVRFHKPGENNETEDHVVTPKTHRLFAKHLKRGGGV